MNVKEQGNLIHVHIENSCPKNMALNLVNGLPQTTKENKREHGFGLRSMRLLSQQLGGEIDFTIDQDRFNLDIVLPIPVGQEAKKQE